MRCLVIASCHNVKIFAVSSPVKHLIHFTFDRVSAAVAGDIFSMLRYGEPPRFPSYKSSTNTRRRSWAASLQIAESVVRWRESEMITSSISELRCIRLTSSLNYLKVGLGLSRKINRPSILRVAWNAKICLQALSSRYRDACSHVAKRVFDDGVRSNAGSAAAANKG